MRTDYLRIQATSDAGCIGLAEWPTPLRRVSSRVKSWNDALRVLTDQPLADSSSKGGPVLAELAGRHCRMNPLRARLMLPRRAMDPPTDYVLAETRLEDRDGACWVSGLCPYCWQRLAFRLPPRGVTAQVCCPNGHRLRIAERTSEGGAVHTT